jgi:histone H3/H4
MDITKPSIIRLARKSGVKSMSNDCCPVIRDYLLELVTKIVKTSLIVNSEQNTKTLMTDDVYKAIRINGDNIAESSEIK